jgi:hypothetical protein
MKTSILASFVSAFVLLASPARAAATEIPDCLTLITVLYTDTNNPALYDRAEKFADKTMSVLLQHLDKAYRELAEQGDAQFAAKQMGNYLTSLSRAVQSGKFIGDPMPLVDEAGQVIACINSIGQ